MRLHLKLTKNLRGKGRGRERERERDLFKSIRRLRSVSLHPILSQRVDLPPHDLRDPYILLGYNKPPLPRPRYPQDPRDPLVLPNSIKGEWRNSIPFSVNR
jgi:hypothetical protein